MYNVNEMMQIMMSNQTVIKIKPFSRKAKDYPQWELKQIKKCSVTDMGRVLDESCAETLPGIKTIELDPMKPEHEEWAKYRQQDVTALAAMIVGAQESGDEMFALQD